MHMQVVDLISNDNLSWDLMYVDERRICILRVQNLVSSDFIMNLRAVSRLENSRIAFGNRGHFFAFATSVPQGSVSVSGDGINIYS